MRQTGSVPIVHARELQLIEGVIHRHPTRHLQVACRLEEGVHQTLACHPWVHLRGVSSEGLRQHTARGAPYWALMSIHWPLPWLWPIMLVWFIGAIPGDCWNG